MKVMACWRKTSSASPPFRMSAFEEEKARPAASWARNTRTLGWRRLRAETMRRSTTGRSP